MPSAPSQPGMGSFFALTPPPGSSVSWNEQWATAVRAERARMSRLCPSDSGGDALAGREGEGPGQICWPPLSPPWGTEWEEGMC